VVRLPPAPRLGKGLSFCLENVVKIMAAVPHPELESSMTTTSSTLKMAAVLAICPAIAVASSVVWAFSMTEPGTAMERVGSTLPALPFAVALSRLAPGLTSVVLAAFLHSSSLLSS